MKKNQQEVLGMNNISAKMTEQKNKWMNADQVEGSYRRGEEGANELEG